MLRGHDTSLLVLVVWEHVTPSDHGLRFPGTKVLARVSDARAVQFWDDDRVLSRIIVHDLPADTLPSMAQMDATVPVAWDCVALFRPGVRWLDRFPTPDWAGRPVVDMADSLSRHLSELEPPPPGDPRR